MTRERLRAILDEYKTNPDTFNKSGPGYFLEFMPAIEGYFSYAEAIAKEAEQKDRLKKIADAAKRSEELHAQAMKKHGRK
jgi:hypothetical protein